MPRIHRTAKFINNVFLHHCKVLIDMNCLGVNCRFMSNELTVYVMALAVESYIILSKRKQRKNS